MTGSIMFGRLNYSTSGDVHLSWKQRDEARQIAKDTVKYEIDKFLKRLPKAMKILEEIGVID